MIGKAKSCIGGFSLFNYVINQEKGYELLRNQLCGETPLEIMQEMKIIQDLNQKATNKLISLVLSPHINDGEKLSKKEQKEIVKDFLEELEMDWENDQYLVFVHTEKRHRHFHILLNRVQKDSTLKADHHIGKKAQWAAHRAAQKYGLVSAKQIRIDTIKNLEKETFNKKGIRKTIFEKHKKVMANHPLSLEKYISEMSKSEVEFIPTINKKGELQGFRVRDFDSQMEMKASDVHQSLGLKSLLESGLPIMQTGVLLHAPLLEPQKIAEIKAVQLKKELENQRKAEIQKQQLEVQNRQEPQQQQEKERYRIKR